MCRRWRCRRKRGDRPVLPVDSTAKFRRKSLTFRIEGEARFYTRRAGILFRKVHYFQCKKGKREFRSDKFLKERQFQALLEKQKREPALLLTDRNSGLTWWMFQENFFWEDYSVREIVDKMRDRSDVMLEVKTLFLQGTKEVYGISAITYRFECSLGHRAIRQKKSLTNEQYRSLSAKQRGKPVRLLTDFESSRTWWMYKDKIYWEDGGLHEASVKEFIDFKLQRQFKTRFGSTGLRYSGGPIDNYLGTGASLRYGERPRRRRRKR